MNKWTPETQASKATEFQTPLNVARYMAAMIPKNTRTLLEPTPGIGNLVTASLEHFAEMKIGVDITTPEDFYLMEPKRFNCVIMNPPFSSLSANLTHAPVGIKGMVVGYDILDRCMEMSEHVIALMPWFTIIDSDLRLRKLKSFGLKSVTALPRKTFNYARIQTCVIELDWNYRGETIFKTLPTE